LGGGRTVGGQRERILGALAEVVVERGFAGASVGLVIARARVSRRTFYERFDGLEDCFRAVLDVGSARTVELVSGAFAREDCWQDGVRSALASLLVFLDSEPLLARVWLVESLAAGSWALEHREGSLRVLRELVVGGWPVSGSWSAPPLAAEGVMSAVLGVLHAHIVTGKPEPLIELLGPLMGLIAGPYLSAKGVAREIQRGEELARAIRTGEDPRWPPLPPRPLVVGGMVEWGVGFDDVGQDAALGGMLGGAIPAMLCNPTARRARECLVFLAEHPGSSNRDIAVGIGVAHRSQISALLSYFLKEQLVSKRSEGPGKANVWQLTPHGEKIWQRLRGGTRAGGFVGLLGDRE
jgi:AcrR family transcriptional regulator